jgi:hypothetical protein
MLHRTPLLLTASVCVALGCYFLGEAVATTHVAERVAKAERWKLEGHLELAHNDGAVSITINLRFARNTDKLAVS